jgi:WD40 repeat protein
VRRRQLERERAEEKRLLALEQEQKEQEDALRQQRESEKKCREEELRQQLEMIPPEVIKASENRQLESDIEVLKQKRRCLLAEKLERSGRLPCCRYGDAQPRCVRVLPKHPAVVSDISWAPDSLHLAVATTEHIYIWHALESSLVVDIPQPKCLLNTVSCSPSGNYVAFGGRGAHRVTLAPIDLKARTPGAKSEHVNLVGHAGAITSLSFLSAKKLLSGSADTTCKMWDVESKRAVVNCKGHVQRVTGVQKVHGIGHSGVVVSSSIDGTCMVWDLRSGVAVQKLRGHASAVTSISCFPGGSSFCSAGDDGKCVSDAPPIAYS